MKKAVLSLVILLLLAFVAIPQVSLAATIIGTGGSEATGIPQQNIFVRSSNGTFVAVWEDSNSDIISARSTDAGATWTKLDGSAGTTMVASSSTKPSLAIDNQDNIHVTYSSGLSGRYVKLTYSSGSWTVGTSSSIGLLLFNSNPVAVASTGRIWVAGILSSGLLRVFFSDNGSSWTISTTVSLTVSNGSPQLVLLDDLPVVLYYDTTTSPSLRYQTFSGSSWSPEQVITAVSTGNNKFAAVKDGSNNIHLVYQNSGIYYKRYDGASWRAADVTISTEAHDTDPKIALDSSGYPLIAWSRYNSSSDNDLVYRSSSAGGWISSPLELVNDGSLNRHIDIPLRLSTGTLPYIYTVGTSDPFTLMFDSTTEVVPTANPTPTTPDSTSSSSTTQSSSPSNTSCNDQSPSSAPDLFQIETTLTDAKLFFTPVNPVSYYAVSYAKDKADANEYATTFAQGKYDGVLSTTIGSLSPGSLFYFKVRGGNGCKPGEWSPIVAARTKVSSSIKRSSLIPTRKTDSRELISPAPTDHSITPTPRPTHRIAQPTPPAEQSFPGILHRLKLFFQSLFHF